MGTGPSELGGTLELTSPVKRCAASVLLGLFICLELVYFPVANALKLIPLRKPTPRGELLDDPQIRATPDRSDLWLPLDYMGAACDRWGELTGQVQGWSLFAPHFGRVGSLPVVRLQWRQPAREVRLSGHFAPADPERPHFRLPSPRGRLFGYDYRLALAGCTFDSRPLDAQSADLAANAAAQVRRQYRSMLAYLRWNLDRYCIAHPTEPMPDVAELRAVMYPPPDAATGLRPRGRELPLAAWELGVEPPPGRFPLRFLDPATGNSVWLPAEDGP